MDGIEKIIAQINTDANKEIAALNDDTAQKCQEIMADARNAAEREAASALERGKRSAEERLEQLKSASSMKTRILKLDAKQEVLNAAFDKALQNLESLPRERYVEVMVGLAAQAAVSKTGELVFSPADREEVGAQVVAGANERIGGALRLSEETRSIGSGFVLVDGNTEINCSFETLVKRQREGLEQDVARILFA